MKLNDSFYGSIRTLIIGYIEIRTEEITGLRAFIVLQIFFRKWVKLSSTLNSKISATQKWQFTAILYFLTRSETLRSILK